MVSGTLRELPLTLSTNSSAAIGHRCPTFCQGLSGPADTCGPQNAKPARDRGSGIHALCGRLSLAAKSGRRASQQEASPSHTRAAPRRVPETRKCASGLRSQRGTRRSQPNQEVSTSHAVRFNAPAAGGRCPLRPPDATLESQDAPVHLCRAQRDPHHRSRPDRQAPGRCPRVRQRDGRAWRLDPLRWHQEAGAGADRSKRRRVPRCPMSTSAGWVAC